MSFGAPLGDAMSILDSLRKRKKKVEKKKKKNETDLSWQGAAKTLRDRRHALQKQMDEL